MPDVSEFPSTYSWCEYHGLEWSDDVPADMRQEWFALRDSLWQRHFASLSPHLQHLLEEERHPGDSWEYAEEAGKYAAALKTRLKDVAYVRGVGVGHYHGDTLVLTVEIDTGISWREFGKVIPELFEGFQVFVSARREDGNGVEAPG